MFTLKYRNICLLILISLSSCTSNRREAQVISADSTAMMEIKLVAPEGRHQDNSFFALVDSIMLIPLETDSTFLLGSVAEVRCVQDTLFVLSASSSPALLVFDAHGNKLFALNQRGRGPAEFADITSFMVSNRYIILFDDSKAVLLFFDRSGKYLFQRDTHAYGVALLGSDMLVEYDGANQLDLTDFYGKKRNSFQIGTRGIESIDPEYFAVSGSSLLFVEKVSQTIYKVTPESLTSYMHIDLGPNQIPDGYYKNFSGAPPNNMYMNLYQKTMLGTEYSILNGYGCNESWEYILTGHKMLGRCFFREKATGCVFLLPPRLTDDDQGFQYLTWVPSGSFGDFFITAANPDRLLSLAVADDLHSPMLKRLQQKIRGLNIDDDSNPVLMFYRLSSSSAPKSSSNINK